MAARVISHDTYFIRSIKSTHAVALLCMLVVVVAVQLVVFNWWCYCVKTYLFEFKFEAKRLSLIHI